MKRACRLCIVLLGLSIVDLIVHSVRTYLSYRKNPELYMVMSAPWYTELEIHLVFTMVVALILLVIRALLMKKSKKQERK